MRARSTLANALIIGAALVLALVTAQPAAAQVVRVEIGVAGMT